MSLASLLSVDESPMVENATLIIPLLARIASGDSSAVEECLNVYGGLVWSIAKKMSGSNAETEDAVQEIFIELWQVAGRFDPAVASEATFITMIARRRLIDRLRKNRIRLDRPHLNSAELERIAEPELNPVELADEAAKAAICFEKLARDAQRVLHLSIHQGFSHSEIAQHLSIPIGTIKSYARRGLLQLRDCMKRGSIPLPAGDAS